VFPPQLPPREQQGATEHENEFDQDDRRMVGHEGLAAGHGAGLREVSPTRRNPALLRGKGDAPTSPPLSCADEPPLL
jgi:hypothetical protein